MLHVVRALERQDEEDRKRRKVEQEKCEAARTGDARRSEPKEETREKRPAEEEVERDNKRSRSTNDETSTWLVWTARRSMKTDCTSRAWRPTRMKTSAMRTSVTRSSKKGCLDDRTGDYLDPELVAKARSEEVAFMAKIAL